MAMMPGEKLAIQLNNASRLIFDPSQTGSAGQV
jgi:hypothetical protein